MSKNARHITKQPTMEADEFRDILKRMHWTYPVAAEELGISASSIAGYGCGTARIPMPVAKLLRSWLPNESGSFKLSIRTGNAAFEDDNKSTEIARILRELANRIEHYGHTDGKIYDVNGNHVGDFLLAPPPADEPESDGDESDD